MEVLKITLSSVELSKRVTATLLEMKAAGISEKKGGVLILKELQRILIERIPALEEELKFIKTILQYLNITLILLAASIFLYIITPNPADLLTLSSAIDRVGFVNSFMGVVIGLFVSVASLIFWSKGQSYRKVKVLTDDIHIMMHRLDMIQLGKKEFEIFKIEDGQAQEKIKAYIKGVYLGVRICGKCAAIINLATEDEAISRMNFQIEQMSLGLSSAIKKSWPTIFLNE